MWFCYCKPSVFSHCWLCVKKGIDPVKKYAYNNSAKYISVSGLALSDSGEMSSLYKNRSLR